MNVLFFVIMLFSLFGPKFGYIDTSILGGIIGLLILFKLNKIKSPKVIKVLVVLLSVLMVYSLIIYGKNGFRDAYFVLRNTRVLFATVFLGIVIYNFPFNSSSMLNIIIYVLLLNAIAVLFQIFIPSSKLVFASIYQFNKNFAFLRAFGLTSGYDSAGYLCVMGYILSSLSAFYRTKSFKFIVISFIFLAATFFTSRTTILITIGVTVSLSIFFAGGKKFILKIISVIWIIMLLIVAKNYILPLFSQTFNFYLLNYNNKKVDFDFQKSFAYTDLEEWQNQMWTLPENIIDIIIGNGIDPESDIGYIKIIYMEGIVGLLFIIGIYLFIFYSVVRIVNTKLSLLNKQNLEVHKILSICLPLFVLLQFIFNIKNLYFLTRSYYELLLALLVIALINVKSTTGSGYEYSSFYSLRASWVK